MNGLYAPSPAAALAFAGCFFGWALFEMVLNQWLWRPGSLNRDGFSRYLIIGGTLLASALAVAATRLHAFDFGAGRGAFSISAWG